MTVGYSWRGKNTPWRNLENIAIPPAVSQWEALLAKLGVADGDAMKIAEGRMNGPRERMYAWAKEHRGRCFIPEKILFEFKLQLDDEVVSFDLRSSAAKHARRRQSTAGTESA